MGNSKNLKRLQSAILIAFLTIGTILAPVPSFADETFTVSAGSASVSPGAGNTVTVPITIKSDGKIGVIEVIVKYDSSKLEIMGKDLTVTHGAIGAVLKNVTVNEAYSNSEVFFSYYTIFDTEVDKDGVLATVSFKLTDAAAGGDVISITPRIRTSCDFNNNSLSWNVQPGTISVLGGGSSSGSGKSSSGSGGGGSVSSVPATASTAAINTGSAIVETPKGMKEITYKPEDWGSIGEDDYVVAYDATSGKILPISAYSKSLGKLVYESTSAGTVSGKYNFTGFSDVNENLWSSAYIWYDSARGIVNGMEDGKFRPENKVTRAQFLKMLASMTPEFDTESYQNDGFVDIKAGSWYEKYVGWAVENGIATGYSADQFGPEKEITREQMCVMLEKYLEHLGYEPKVSDGASFSDAGRISSWASESVGALNSAGFVTGKPGNQFDPKGSMTRGESAAVICRLIRSLSQSISIPAYIDWQSQSEQKEVKIL